jgi:inosine-uridine nucleoside N-ribohydrolase
MIKENSRRQEIESKKKKESLEMLAEEMGEKNELISELQTALRFYESRQGRNGNCVLDEDGVALRRELENMQEIH